MLDEVSGFLAAVASSLFGTVGFIIYGESWLGSPFQLNLFKCSLGSFLFLLVCYFYPTLAASGSGLGSWEDSDVSMLCISSLIGIVVGDLVWLQSLSMIGARRVIVVDSIKPFIAALLGAGFLDEALHTSVLVGMCLTVLGVLMVSLESDKGQLMGEENGEDGLAQIEISTTTDNALRSEDGEKEEKEGEACTRVGNRDFRPTHSSGSDGGGGGAEFPVPKSMQKLEYVAADVRTRTRKPNSNMSSSSQTMNAASETAIIYKGYTLAGINVALDAIGSLLTKIHGAAMSTWEINLIRFGFASVCLVAMLYLVYILEAVMKKPARGRVVSDMGRFDRVEGEDIDTSENGDRDVGEAVIRFHDDDDDDDDGCRTDSRGSGGGGRSSNRESFSSSSYFMIPTQEVLEIPKMTAVQWHTVALGVLFVTFTCPALSNYALFKIDLGTCLTLTSLGPLFSLPLVWLIRREVVSCRGVLGAFLSVIGIAIMSNFK